MKEEIENFKNENKSLNEELKNFKNQINVDQKIINLEKSIKNNIFNLDLSLSSYQNINQDKWLKECFFKECDILEETLENKFNIVKMIIKKAKQNFKIRFKIQ